MSVSISSFAALNRYSLLGATGLGGTSSVTVTNGFYGTPAGVGITGGPFIGTPDNTANATTAQTELASLKSAISTASSGLTAITIGPAAFGVGTFLPGNNYTSTSSITFSGGTLTFDAIGNPNAQFFITAASGITFNNVPSITLLNNALNCNIFFLANTGAITFTGSMPTGTVPGIFVAGTAITFANPINISGRIFAQSNSTFTGTSTVNGLCTTPPTPPIIAPPIVPGGGVIITSQISSSNGDQPTKKSDLGDTSRWIRLKRIRGTAALANVLETKRDITNPPARVPNAVINGQRITEFGTSRMRRLTSTWTDSKAFSASYIAPNVVTLDSMNAKIAALVSANPPPVPVITPELPGSFFGQLETILASLTTPSTILVSIYNSVREYYSRAPFSFTGSIYGFTSNTVTNDQMQALPNGAGILIPQFTALTIGDSTYQVENVVGGRLIKTPLSGGSATFFTRNSGVTTTGLTPNVTFTYLGSGCPGLCSVTSGTPSSFTASYDSQTSTLSYTPIPGDTFYRIFYANGSYTAPTIIGTGTTSVFVDYLFSLPYAAYDVSLDYYVVATLLGRNISIASNIVSIRIRSPAINVVASNVTKNSATLTWDPPISTVSGDNLIGYGIWDRYSGRNFIVDTSSTATTYNVTGLTPVRSYELQVRPKYQSGYGAIADTSTARFSTLYDTIPTIVATYNSATRTVSWVTSDPPPGVIYYRIIDSVTNLNIASSFGGEVPLSNPYTFTDEPENYSGTLPTTIAAQVAFTTGAGQIKSNAFNVFFGAKVTGLASSNVTGTSLTLNWTALAGASSYIIYKDAVQLATSNTNSYSVTSLSASTAYAFTVKAVYSGGNGVLSDSLSVTTQAASGLATPTNLRVTSVTNTTVVYEWDPVAEATFYNVWYVVNDFTSVTAPITTYTYDALHGNQQATLRIQSVKSGLYGAADILSEKSAAVTKYTLSDVPSISSQDETTIAWQSIDANYFQIFIDGTVFETYISGSVTEWDFSGNLPADGLRTITMKSFNQENVGSAFSAPLQKPFGAYHPAVTSYNIDSASPDNMIISWTRPPYAENLTGYDLVLIYGTSNITRTQVGTSYTFPANVVNSGEQVQVEIVVDYDNGSHKSTPFGFSFTAQ